MEKNKIVVLSARGAESFTLEQRTRLAKAGPVRYVSAPRRMGRAAFVDVLQEASLAALNPRGTPLIDEKLLARLPQLRRVVLPTTGTEWIDVALLERHGVEVTHLPGYSTDSTAEFTWALLLALARRLPEALRARRRASLRGMELRGKTLGIVGFGAVGRRTGAIAEAFGLEVLACDPRPVRQGRARFVELDTLLSSSDCIALHLPLTDETRGLLHRERMDRVRPGALLVNTARPALLPVEIARCLLDSGRLGGYAVDMGYLPRRTFAALARHPRAIVVPHISWYTTEAAEREMEQWVEAIRASARERRRSPLTTAPCPELSA